MESLPRSPRLSVRPLLTQVRNVFQSIPDHRQIAKRTISVSDALMSGLAVFSLKFPSLLKFDEQREEQHIRYNLDHLFGVTRAPSDTQLREILDPVEPAALHPAFRTILKEAEDSGALESYRFLNGFLVSIDGTGHFCSSAVSCPDCAIKNSRSGVTQYYHQLLAGVIVHPERKNVLPLIPEPITRADGNTKNDCERNAAKRLLTRLRQNYPDHPFVIVQDALSATGPQIKLLKELNFSYILGAKEGDHATLFEAIAAHREEETLDGRVDTDTKRGTTRIYHFKNNVVLNKSHPDLTVNFIEYIELKNGQIEYRGTWVTDLTITQENCADIVRGGRARWKIENETFNTLKNQGYRLEHNYGHGKQHLATVFGLLTMLAFLIDQVQELACPLFHKARQRFRSRTSLWERMRALFVGYFIDDWEIFWQAIIGGHQVAILWPKAAIDNTS
jgi:hypothetical protein